MVVRMGIWKAGLPSQLLAIQSPPTPGFAGADSFEYEASAAGRGGAPLRLVVRVTIEVSAP
jgi:hypothetical protein